MNDKNGTKVSRGTRVLVTFPEANLVWTGKVVGKSYIDGRVRVQSEYVNWKPSIHLLPESFVRLPVQTVGLYYRDANIEVERPFGTF